MSRFNPQVVAGFLNALSVAAANPVFSGAGIAVSAALRFGAKLIEAGDAGVEELEKLTSEIKAMVAEGREPSAQEWKSLRARSDSAHARIQATAPIEGEATSPQPVDPAANVGATASVGRSTAVPAIGSRQPEKYVPNRMATQHRTSPAKTVPDNRAPVTDVQIPQVPSVKTDAPEVVEKEKVDGPG